MRANIFPRWSRRCASRCSGTLSWATLSLTHSLTLSLTHPLTRLLTCSLAHSPSHSLTDSFSLSLTHSLTHPLTLSLTLSLRRCTSCCFGNTNLGPTHPNCRHHVVFKTLLSSLNIDSTPKLCAQIQLCQSQMNHACKLKYLRGSRRCTNRCSGTSTWARPSGTPTSGPQTLISDTMMCFEYRFPTLLSGLNIDSTPKSCGQIQICVQIQIWRANSNVRAGADAVRVAVREHRPGPQRGEHQPGLHQHLHGPGTPPPTWPISQYTSNGPCVNT